MKEQIKEMYGDVRNAIVHNSAVDFSRGCILSVDFDGVTRELYDDVYRKQIDGEWKWISDDDVICSACGKVFYTADNADAGLSIWSFCPNCGAKIKGGE